MEGCLFTFVGPSGVGKSEVLKEIEKRFPDLLARSVSTTTRIRRSDENESDFHFKNEEEFHKMIANGEFLEYNNYVGNYYGTSFSSLIPLLEDGKNVVKVIEVNGVKSIKNSNKMQDVRHKSIFIDAPSREVREERINMRGRLPEGEILARLKAGDDELKFYFANKNYFNYYIINNNLDKAVRDVLKIIRKA